METKYNLKGDYRLVFAEMTLDKNLDEMPEEVYGCKAGRSGCRIGCRAGCRLCRGGAMPQGNFNESDLESMFVDLIAA